MQTVPAMRPAFILFASVSNPIPLGAVGFWFDGKAINRVAADGTQAPLTVAAGNPLALDTRPVDIAKVSGAAQGAGSTGLAADAGHRHQLDPSAFKSFYFSGLAAPGA